jgi:hypothetical protein
VGVVSISVVIKKTQDFLENNLLVNDQFALTAEMKGWKSYDFSTVTTLPVIPPSIIYDYLTNTEYGWGLNSALIILIHFMRQLHIVIRWNIMQMVQ